MLRVLAPLLAALAAAGNATELDSTSDIAEVGTLREAAGIFCQELLRNFLGEKTDRERGFSQMLKMLKMLRLLAIAF
jgi:hypothetical protein